MSGALRLLLQLVNAKADASYMLRNGLSYSQISALFGDAIQQELIVHVEDHAGGMGFIVTDKGKEMLSTSEARTKFGEQARWISPDIQYICEPIGLEDVFLPKRRDSYFSAT